MWSRDIGMLLSWQQVGSTPSSNHFNTISVFFSKWDFLRSLKGVFFFNSGPLCAWRHFWNDFGWENWIFQRKFLGRFITEMKTRKITAIVSANFHSGSIVVFTGTTPFMKIVKWNKLAFLFCCGRHLALNYNFPSRFRRRFSSSD